MLQIRVETSIDAEPMRVWETLADHENMDKWTSFRKVVRKRPGALEANGIGAVRRLSAPGRVMEERITRFDPARCLEYDVLKGAPGWAAKGQVVLTPTQAGGTLVCWTIRLHPYLPGSGGLIRRFMQRALADDLARLRERLEPELLFAFTRAPTGGAPVRLKPARTQPLRPRGIRPASPEL